MEGDDQARIEAARAGLQSFRQSGLVAFFAGVRKGRTTVQRQLANEFHDLRNFAHVNGKSAFVVVLLGRGELSRPDARRHEP